MRAYFNVVLVVAASQALEQQRPQSPRSIVDDPIVGVRTVGDWYADTVATRSCPSFVLREPIPPEAVRSEKPISARCVVATTRSLPATDAERWMTAVYVRSTVYAADSVTLSRTQRSRDTIEVLTAALYRWRSERRAWTPVWVGTVDRSSIWSMDVRTAARPDGSVLVGIRSCLNGTGGCQQRYLRRSTRGWVAVVEAFWRQMPPLDGGQLGKGRGIDLATLSGSYGVYSPADANCCPSREVHIELDQRGDSLVLKRYRVIATSP